MGFVILDLKSVFGVKKGFFENDVSLGEEEDGSERERNL